MIEQILISDKDNRTKFKKQFVNNDLIYQERKPVPTNLTI